MSELKTPVSTTIKYLDGSETTLHYNELGEKMSEETQAVPVAEAPVETPVEAPVETPAVAPEAPAVE